MMKQGMLNSHLIINVKDKDGNIIEQLNRPSRSWVENYYVFVFGQAANVPSLEAVYGTEMYSQAGVKVESSTGRPPYAEYGTGNWAYNSSIVGAQIGTGTGAESYTDFVLGAIISNGSASGEMSFGASINTYSLDGTTHECTISRIFTNNSGATITVNETGLYGDMEFPVVIPMFNRDKLDTGIAVANSQTIYVGYKITLDFGFA